jgi:hypothetical protein
MLMLVDSKPEQTQSADTGLLTSSLCAATLGFQLGSAGVQAIFEAVVARKLIMEHSE